MKSLKNLSLAAVSLIACLAGATSVQAIPTWAESYGVGNYIGDKVTDDPFYGSGFDFPVAMAKMPDGGFVVAGQLDIPKLYPIGYHTSDKAMATLVRFAADGTILWQKLLRQTNDTNVPGSFIPAVSHVYRIATDAQGNIFIAGGKGNPNNSGVVPFVAKFSPAGDLIWQNGIGEASATVGDPAQTVPLGVGSTTYMGLTNDGGVVITLSQSRPNIGYSIPVLAKFDSNGALVLYKAYDNQIQYLGTTPVCQSNDGSRFVMAFVYATDGSALGSRYGLLLLVTDSAGNIVAQRGYNHSDAPGEQPVAIVATADGGYATISVLPDYAGGIVRKFNADLSAEVFHSRITGAPGHNQHIATNTLVETADGGFLIGGETVNDFSVSQYDVMLMKVGSAGSLQFVSILGGPKNDGGPLSNGPTTAFALETADGGYGLGATTGSYSVGGMVNGGFSVKPDWWMAKMDANRKVRNFTGAMLDQPLDFYEVTGSPETAANVTEFFAPTYPYGAATTPLPQFIFEDLGSASGVDLPTLAIQASSPRIIGAHNAEAVVGQHFAYHTLTAFFPVPGNVTFSATNLPSGFVINGNTGVISGIAPIGSETNTPIAITLQATDGTDTTSTILNLTIGDGVPQFGVNGSDAPTDNVIDSVLTFTARYPGKPAGRIVTVQAATDPAGNWADLDNGSTGYMIYDPNGGIYALGSTNYPQQAVVYFRAKVKAQGFADVFSNVVGPFNLSSDKARAGKTLFRLKRNGLRADFDFRATALAAADGIAVRVQSTKTPENEGSWIDLQNISGNPLPAMDQEDAARYSLKTNTLVDNSGVYFRAIAKGPNGTPIIDAVSNLIGPYSYKFTTPPHVEITSPASGGVGQSIGDPLIINANANGVAQINIHATATAGNNRAISQLSILFDGGPAYTISSGAASAAIDYLKNTNVIGDHVIEALAFDDLGVTGRAGTGPLYIRIVPSTSSAQANAVSKTSGISSLVRVFHVVNSGGNWHDPSTWQDSHGNSGVPGLTDFAVIGGATVVMDDPNFDGVVVKTLSLDGGHVVGPSILSVTDMVTLSGGSFDNDMTLHIVIGSVCELLNANDLVFNGGSNGTGSFDNAGVLNVHGAGSLKGVSDFRNRGLVNWQQPLLPSAAIAAALSPDLRSISAAAIHDAGKIAAPGLITNDGGSLITNDGGSLITNDGGSLITNDGGSLIGNDGASLITNDGGSLIGNDGASLIGNDGASLITNDGGSLIAGLPSALKARSFQTAAPTQTGYFKDGGEIDLTNVFIAADVTLNSGVVSGSGVIAGSLTNNGGYIAPGHSPGAISVTGNFTQGANGTIVLEAAGAEEGQFDLIEVGGTATLGGKLDFRTINGYVPLAGDPLNPIGYGAVTGAFGSISSNANVTINDNGILAVINPNASNPPAGQPGNISTRLNVQTGDNVLIGGFIVTGPSGSTKKVLIRGIGPSLSGAGIIDPLSDPFLEFHKAGEVETNDDWQQTPNADQIPDNLKPTNSHESAIVATLAPGDYTAILKGAHDETGVGLVEVFDLDPASPAQLGNLSTRGFVQTGDNVMIGGLIVNGNEPGKILVRALGPSLTDAGIVNVLADPILELHDSSGTVISNDDWRSTQETEISATGLAPSQESEAAILMTLPPGSYTAIVVGKNVGTGVALIEAYTLP